jgi:hypothetical protein
MTQEIQVILTLKVDTTLPIKTLKDYFKEVSYIYINGEVAASFIKLEVKEEAEIYKNE